MAVVCPMMHETVWFDQPKFEKAEAHYQEYLVQQKYGAGSSSPAQGASSNLVNEIARARQQIQSTLNTSSSPASSIDQANRIEKLEKENKDLKKMLDNITNRIKKLELRMGSMDSSKTQGENSQDTDEGFEIIEPMEESKPEPAKPADDDDDDDDDLFGGSSSDEDEEEAKRAAEERKKKFEDGKKKKAGPIAKSSIVIDVKPWDDETDLKVMEAAVRKISCDGLEWKAAQLEPIAFGLQKLRIMCNIEDEKVQWDFLEEGIMGNEDLVQSVDIYAWNKL